VTAEATPKTATTESCASPQPDHAARAVECRSVCWRARAFARRSVCWRARVGRAITAGVGVVVVQDNRETGNAPPPTRGLRLRHPRSVDGADPDSARLESGYPVRRRIRASRIVDGLTTMREPVPHSGFHSHKSGQPEAPRNVLCSYGAFAKPPPSPPSRPWQVVVSPGVSPWAQLSKIWHRKPNRSRQIIPKAKNRLLTDRHAPIGSTCQARSPHVETVQPVSRTNPVLPGRPPCLCGELCRRGGRWSPRSEDGCVVWGAVPSWRAVVPTQ
jgi:hypothetical protein